MNESPQPFSEGANVNPAEKEAAFTKLISESQNFEALYAAVHDIRSMEKGFCPEKMLSNIEDIEEMGDPRIADMSMVFGAITRTYGLRDKVIELTRKLTPKPQPEQTLRTEQGEKDDSRSSGDPSSDERVGVTPASSGE